MNELPQGIIKAKMSKKIIILVGSATKKSRSLSLAENIQKTLVQKGSEVELIDLLELRLPVYDVTTEKTDSYDDKTRRFLETSRQVDGWVWVTPVYHNSYSSLLKTALDWQHWFFDHKVLGLASHSERSTAAVDQLLMVARAQHFVPIPTRVCTANEDYDAEKQLTNKDIHQRIDRFAEEFTDFLDRFNA